MLNLSHVVSVASLCLCPYFALFLIICTLPHVYVSLKEFDDMAGLVIGGVTPGSLAADMGLKIGDLIVAIDGVHALIYLRSLTFFS